MATVETDSSRLLAERRAKLAKLRGEIFVQDRDITSAPALTLVDEFHETFGAADQRHGLAAGETGGLNHAEHRIFYAANGRPPPPAVSNLDTNLLVAEANKRGQHKISQQHTEDQQPPQVVDYIEDMSCMAMEKGNIHPASAEGGVEDLGYQSSLSSPSDRRHPSTCTVISMPTQGATRGPDSLSQSLPEGVLKAVKTDLAQSLSAIAERAKSRGIFDPGRLFDNGGAATAAEVTSVRNFSSRKGEEEEEEREGGGDETEQEYFRRMTRLQGRVRDSVVSRSQSFQHFLHQSFSGSGSGDARRRSKEETAGSGADMVCTVGASS